MCGFQIQASAERGDEKRLKEIAENEGLEIDDEALEVLIYISGGDFRKAINALQGAAALDKRITPEILYQITATARPEELRKIIDTALKGNYLQAKDMLENLMAEYGMSGEDVVSQLFREIMYSNLDEKLKVVLIDKLGEIDFRLTEGASELIQLNAYLAFLSTIQKRRGE